MKTIAIVGGGISGLSAAEAIARHGAAAGIAVRPVVLEAGAVPGGKIGTLREGGHVIETGPHGFLDKEPKALALIDRLGLKGSLLAADESSADCYIVRAGRLRRLPSSPPAFLTSDVLPLAARLRVACEPLIKARKNGAEESVWDFAARRIGPVAADVMVDALVTGIYGGDPKRLSVRAAFPLLVDLEARYGGLIKGQIAKAKEAKRLGTAGPAAGGPRGTLHSFTRGLAELIDALASRAELEVGFRASAIERLGDRFKVSAVDGRSLEADAVFVTAPADEIARLVLPFAEPEAASLAAIPYAPIAVVVQSYQKDDLAGAPSGFGFLVPNLEQRQILGAIFASAVFAGHAPDGRVMLRIMVGGARHPELLERSDEEIGELARNEVLALLGVGRDVRPELERIIRWPRAIPQYELAHPQRVASADAIEAKVPGLFLGGNALRGVAMIQCIAEADRIGARMVRRWATM